jgi:hypothetical protein
MVERAGREFGPVRSIERIFATKAALTTQVMDAETPRSRFGHSDSWFIKKWGAADLAVGS